MHLVTDFLAQVMRCELMYYYCGNCCQNLQTFARLIDGRRGTLFGAWLAMGSLLSLFFTLHLSYSHKNRQTQPTNKTKHNNYTKSLLPSNNNYMRVLYINLCLIGNPVIVYLLYDICVYWWCDRLLIQRLFGADVNLAFALRFFFLSQSVRVLGVWN